MQSEQNSANGATPPPSNPYSRQNAPTHYGGYMAAYPQNPPPSTTPVASSPNPLPSNPLPTDTYRPPSAPNSPAVVTTPIPGFSNPQAPKSKINPSQIPSPTSVESKTITTYYTVSHKNPLPPSPTSEYKVIDEGNCSPRFMRMTMYSLPCSSDVQSAAHLPVGVIIQPLADVQNGEDPIPVINLGDAGPIRCQRCRSYINPFSQFTDGGQRYVCKICDFVNDVPRDYFSPLEASGYRNDAHSRPELTKGTVEYIVNTPDYVVNEPHPPCYLFAIDVSYSSVSSGILHTTIHTIKAILNQMPENSSTRVGFVTFDNTVHFYNLNPALQQPQMLVVPDIDKVFLPIAQEVIFVKYKDGKVIVDALLEKIPTMFQNSKVTDSALGAALVASCLALNTTGGKLIAFQTTLPSIGPGKLKRRDEPKLIGTDKEKTLYKAQDSFYSKLGEDCVKSHISVDLFLFPSNFMDVATLGGLSKVTGGQMYFYPSFDWKRDSGKLQVELTRNVLRTTGFEALMRVRASRGLSVSQHFGNFFMGEAGELQLAGVDSDKSFCVKLTHDEKMSERDTPCIQCALLYTALDGTRRIRVHTLRLQCTSVLGSLFKGVDCEAVLNYSARIALNDLHRESAHNMRTKLIEQCVDVLSIYRKFCATSSSPGQLILPESLKLLPIFILSLIKNTLLRAGSDVNPDERAFLAHLLNSIPISQSTPFIYPRMFALHSIPEECGIPDENGHVVLPPLVRLSHEALQADGAYLVENGQRMYLWLGKTLSLQWIKDVFDVTLPVERLQTNELNLVPLDNDTSSRVCWIIDAIRKLRSSYPALVTTKQGDVSESTFYQFLVEDKSHDSPSYVDFLCDLHKQIQAKLN